MAHVVPAAFGRVAGAAAAGMVLVAGCAPAADLADTARQSVADLSELSDEALLRQIESEVEGVHSVRVSVDLRQSDDEMHGEVYLDLDSDDFRSVADAPGLTLEIISVGSDVYVKAPRSYWRDGLGKDREDLITALDGKFGHMAADDPARSRVGTVAKGANPHTIVDTLEKVERQADSVVDGRRMVVLGEPDAKDTTGRLYIPADGPALPFRMTETGSTWNDEDSVSMTWSEYNRPVDIKAPAKDLVVELPSLGVAPKGL
jgi:hypothetical protein